MAPQNTINLIRSKTGTSPQLEAIDASLRKSALIGMIALISVSCIVGTMYYLFSRQYTSIQEEKRALMTQIYAAKSKESLLLAIKERTKTEHKALNNQKPWAKMLDLVATFAQPPTLANISVDEQDKITLSLKSGSLEEIQTIMERIIGYVNENTIKNPQLQSFHIGKNGMYEITISFFAIFTTL